MPRYKCQHFLFQFILICKFYLLPSFNSVIAQSSMIALGNCPKLSKWCYQKIYAENGWLTVKKWPTLALVLKTFRSNNSFLYMISTKVLEIGSGRLQLYLFELLLGTRRYWNSEEEKMKEKIVTNLFLPCCVGSKENTVICAG